MSICLQKLLLNDILNCLYLLGGIAMKFIFKLIKKLLTIIISLAFVAALVLCCISGPMSDKGQGISWFGTPKIPFSAGVYPVDSASLTMVLQPGETELLKDFTMLTSVDFCGSTNYDEIIAWSEANPQVQVKYDIALPTGAVVSPDLASLDLSGLDSVTIEKTAAMFKYLPELKSVELGIASDAASVLPAETVAAVRAALPDGEISYAFSLLGQTLSMDADSVDLSSMKAEDVSSTAALLSCLSNITYVNLGSADTNPIAWSDFAILKEACPNAEFDYSFSIYGKAVNTKTEELDFSYTELPDKGAALREALPFMPKCTFVNMDSCGISNEEMGALQAEFPDKKIVWRVWFGNCYSVRTDATKILASKPSVGGVLDDSINDVLKYCTSMKHIDLGHNEAITDISFVSYMPDLETLVIAMNPLTDISPLANCHKIDYLELNSTAFSDLSPLSELQSLRHLNIANCPNITDISPLYGLKDLERLWIGAATPVPAEQVALMKENAPNIVIDTTTVDPTQGGWRYADLNYEGWVVYAQTGYFQYEYHPRYELLREQFGYGSLDYSFYYKDPTYKGPQL